MSQPQQNEYPAAGSGFGIFSPEPQYTKCGSADQQGGKDSGQRLSGWCGVGDGGNSGKSNRFIASMTAVFIKSKSQNAVLFFEKEIRNFLSVVPFQVKTDMLPFDKCSQINGSAVLFTECLSSICDVVDIISISIISNAGGTADTSEISRKGKRT